MRKKMRTSGFLREGDWARDASSERRFFSFAFWSFSAFAFASFSSFSFACASLANYKRKNIHVINLIFISKEAENNASSPSPL